MQINTSVIKEYVKHRCEIKGSAFRPFTVAVLLCLANRDYLSNEKKLFQTTGKCLANCGYTEYQPDIRPHMRYGLNRGWRLCRQKPENESCPIKAMELIRRAVEIMDWVKDSPTHMASSDARRILWRDQGTDEPFPPLQWPQSHIMEIMRIIHESPSGSVPLEVISKAIKHRDDIFGIGIQSDILKLQLAGFIVRSGNGNHDCYSALWTAEEFQNYIRKKVLKYVRLETREEQIARDALLPEDVPLDDKSVKYLGKLLTLFEVI